jgi:hypothetical protein
MSTIESILAQSFFAAMQFYIFVRLWIHQGNGNCKRAKITHTDVVGQKYRTTEVLLTIVRP